MSKKKDAPTGAATSAEAVEKVLEGSSSAFNFNTGEERGQVPRGAVDLLGVGAGHALSARQIAEAIGCKPRDVSRTFERTRNAGTAVCASREGYFLPADASELLGYIRAFDRRLRAIQRTRRSLEAAYCAMTGQLELWGDELE